MSVLDDLRSLEQRVAARLAELRPLVDEYRELEQLADRLGLDRAAADAAGVATGSERPERKRSVTRRARKRGSSGSSRRAPGGTQELGRKRRETIVGLVNERPGITVPDLGRELDVDPTSLYRVVRRLEADGAIKKEGQNLQPVG